MLNAPVSLFVDTGAGVLLLNGRNWDRIKLNDVRNGAAEYHKFVGMDGHPIRFVDQFACCEYC